MQKKERVKKIIIFHGQMIACIILYMIFINITGIGCPIRRAIHIPCPACGMTRSWIAVLKLDINKAFEYHPLFWFIPFYVLFVIHSGTEWMKKVPRFLFWSVTVIGGILVLIVYIYRIVNGFGPV